MLRRALLLATLIPLGAVAATPPKAASAAASGHKPKPAQTPPAVKIYVDTIKKAVAAGPDDFGPTEVLKRALTKRGFVVLSSPSAAASGAEFGWDKAAYRLTKLVRVNAKLIPPSGGVLNASSFMDIEAVLIDPKGVEMRVPTVESKTQFTHAEWTGIDVTQAGADRAIAELVENFADVVVKLAVPPSAK